MPGASSHLGADDATTTGLIKPRRSGYAGPTAAAMRSLAPFLFAAAACAEGGADVHVTLRFDASVDEARLARVQKLKVAASGAERYDEAVTVGPDVHATREGRLVYRAAVAAGELDLAVEARDERDALVAAGAVSGIRLDPRTPAAVTLVLSARDGDPADAAAPDLEPADLAGADLAGADLAGPRDLALPLPDLPRFCDNSTFILCESFEAPLAAPWSVFSEAYAQAGVVAMPYRGASALRLRYAPSPGDMAAPSGVYATALRNFSGADRLFVRLFIYLEPAVPTLGQLTFVELLQSVDPFLQGELGLTGRALRHELLGAVPKTSLTPLPNDQWLCLEASLDNGVTVAGTLTTRVALAGADLDLALNRPAIMPAINQIRLRLILAPPADTVLPPFNLYFDELAIDDKPIGCPP
jgi:uncharacterized protein YjbI with pentapeptide repeats